MRNLEDGKWEKCACCEHREVCAIKQAAYSIVAEVSNLYRKEEMKGGHFKISVECIHFKELSLKPKRGLDGTDETSS